MAPKKDGGKGKRKSHRYEDSVARAESVDAGVEQMEDEKVRWTPEGVSLLGQCMDRFIVISTGQSGAITGRAIDWRKTVAEFRRQSGTIWDYKRLKSKHDNLKLNFRLWLRLKNGETGLGWNYDLDTVDAPLDWWARKLTISNLCYGFFNSSLFGLSEDKRYARFQRHGFSEELENWLHIVFGTCAARGARQFSTTDYLNGGGGGGGDGGDGGGGFGGAVAVGDGDEADGGDADGFVGADAVGNGIFFNAGPVNDPPDAPGGQQGYDMNSQFDELRVGINNNPQVPNYFPGSTSNAATPAWKNWVTDGSSSLGKRGSSSDDTPGNKKSRRMRPFDENASRLRNIEVEMKISNKARNDMVMYVKGVGSSISNFTSGRDEFSLGRALERLEEVPDLDRIGPMYMFAYSLLCDDTRREAFMRHPTIEGAWNWIEFQFQHGFPGGFGPDLNRKCTIAFRTTCIMDNHNNVAERLLRDPEFYFEFVKKIGTFLVMDDDVIASRALLAATIAHNPPPRFRHHSGAFPGLSWIDDLLSAPNDYRIFNAFRMNKFTFIQLCDTLETRYGLSASEEVTVREKVGIFLHVLAKKSSNRDTQERFSRSGWAVSHYFHEVLNAMDGFGHDIVKPKDAAFTEIPPKITNNPMYMPFVNAVGALDGSHIKIVVEEGMQMACRGRKRETTMNVLAICDFDLLFTFVVTGWEGSAHDAYVLNQAKSTFDFPRPPPGKYYLADKGYANRGCILTPYSSGRYHSSQWRGQPPQGTEETFNRWHSSLRSAVERAFGVLKNRWHILECVPHFRPMDQNRIVASCFALNNYIRLLDPLDELFDAYQFEYVDNGLEDDIQGAGNASNAYEDISEPSMDPTRDAIAAMFGNLG